MILRNGSTLKGDAVKAIVEKYGIKFTLFDGTSTVKNTMNFKVSISDRASVTLRRVGGVDRINIAIKDLEAKLDHMGHWVAEVDI